MDSINTNVGDQLYAIKMVLDRNIKIEVGRLGECDFQKGSYIYIGSAKRNIGSRINRHVTIEKVKRWHLDYFRPFVTIQHVITFPVHGGECQLKEFLQNELLGEVVVPRFGSSDCKCDSHLIKVKREGSENIYHLREMWLTNRH
ncbi:GIY-YIG nuclease family protein [Evansella sp. AB-P1]|uniref:GIY-YIG nuclease family protein n=1 Tax=Evansella sp. AB-P1 TaxID=3037653 RepID=UPI00241E3B84|nr:GIY-YIG nuclease family protein [Evansella sp. AB-P1]MDG5789213.1 GIY-YIG nuclease family protein [Evansella sp. AB-P1]